jgi:hypothetical protein
MRRLLPALPALLLALALPGSALARRAPLGYYGVTWDTALESRPESALDAQWALMHSSGVESVRTVFSWAAAQPTPYQPMSLAATDRIVARAARHHIRLLPVVFGAPSWAELQPGARNSPPASPRGFAGYAHALVARYGGRGSFWRQHPGLPRQPIRDWQIWNEPHLPFYWNVRSGSSMAWPRGYVRLLKAARKAIKHADRNARVVLGGLSEDSWWQLRRLYRLHARRLFDVVAVHPYNTGPKNALVVVRAVRISMRRAHDGRKPLWVTELGWPAARGRAVSLQIDLGLKRLTTTDAGMAKRIGSAYDSFLARRSDRRYGVGRLYWFTWASSYRPGEGGIWDYAGLLITSPLGFAPTPALAAYQRSAHRNES